MLRRTPALTAAAAALANVFVQPVISWTLHTALSCRRLVHSRPQCPCYTQQPSKWQRAAAAVASSRAFSNAAPIDVNSLKVSRAAALRPKPPFDSSLPFGTNFSDHMLEIDWDIQSGFGEPRVVQYHPLPIDPASPCLHYGVQCFEGMKAYRDEKGSVRLFRPGALLGLRVQRHCREPAVLRAMPRFFVPTV